MPNSSIWPIDRTITGATTPGQNGPGSYDNERVLRIPQSSSITGASPSDYLVSYLGHSLVGGGLTTLQRCSRCILQPQQSGLHVPWENPLYIYIYIYSYSSAYEIFTFSLIGKQSKGGFIMWRSAVKLRIKQKNIW